MRYDIEKFIDVLVSKRICSDEEVEEFLSKNCPACNGPLAADGVEYLCKCGNRYCASLEWDCGTPYWKMYPAPR